VGLRAAQGFFMSLFGTMNIVYQIQVVGLDPFQLVLMGTLLEVAIFTCEVPTGVVADVYSRRLSLVLGYVVMGLGMMAMAAFPTFWLFAAAQLVWGVGETFVSGAREAWVADEIPHGPNPAASATAAFMRAEQVQLFALIAGMWASVPLAAQNLSWPIWAGGAGTVLIGVYAALLPERGFKRATERHSWRALTATFRDGLGVARASAILGLIVAVTFFNGLASEGFDRLWNRHVLDLGLPVVAGMPEETWWAVIGTVATLMAIALTGALRRRAAGWGEREMKLALAVLLGVLMVSVAGFALAPAFAVGLGCFLVARAVRRALEPLLTSWLNEHAESRVRATLLSMKSQAHGLGELAGGPVVGWIAVASSVRTALLASAILLLPALGVLRIRRA
jgi:MFS transporter, DHA3 family, tetracycline resistance protein